MRTTILTIILFAVLAPGASANHVACGDLVTTDTTLDSDLQCDGGVGLVIGADGVRLDLNGHSINTSAVALDNRGGYDDLTVTNGTLNGGTAAALAGADSNSFQGVSFQGESGVSISGSSGVRIEDSEVRSGLGGIDIVDSDDTALDDLDVFSSTSGNVIEVGPGSDGTTITGVVLRESTPFSCCASGTGIHVSGGTVGTTIDGNSITGQPRGGIVVDDGAADVTITHNTVVDSSDGSGISVRTSSASIGWNTSDHNGFFGIFAVSGVTDLGGNEASGNGYSFPEETPPDADCRGVVCNAPANVFSGFLSPIAVDGSSDFHLGSTVPVRFTLTDPAGEHVPAASATLHVAEVVGGVVGPYSEAESVNGKGFRYDEETGTYVFNLSTRALSAGTWSLRITLDDGTTHAVRIALS